MPPYHIDLNADVGEGIGNEHQLMPFLSSCSIACGGHAGDSETMKHVLKLAKMHSVKVGAHPSYPDKENFGRQRMDISYSALYTSLKEQIEALQAIAKNQSMQLHHVKPHGALYNIAAKEKETASVIVDVMKRFHVSLKLYVPYRSVIAEIAISENIPVVYEAFADRNYNNDLSLVSRTEKNALIADNKIMLQHVLNIITNKKIKTVNGVEVDVIAQTLCLHGDHNNSVLFAKNLSKNLSKSGVKIQ